MKKKKKKIVIFAQPSSVSAKSLLRSMCYQILIQMASVSVAMRTSMNYRPVSFLGNYLIACYVSPSASLVTTSRMQQSFIVLTNMYSVFLLLFQIAVFCWN